MLAPATPRLVRLALAALTLIMAAYAVHALAGVGDPTFLQRWVYTPAIVLCGLLGMGGGLSRPRERAAWLALGGAIVLWGLGNAYFSALLGNDAAIPIPSVADAFWIAVYPAAYVGLILLLRARSGGFRASLWLDGVIAGAAVAAISAAIVVDVVLAQGYDDMAALATNLAYPLGDLVLLGLVVAVFALAGWRPGRSWTLIGLGLVAFALSDSAYVVLVARDAYEAGSAVDIGWSVAALLLAYAAYQPESEREIAIGGRLVVAVPTLFALVAPVTLIWDHFERLNGVAVGAAGASLVAVIGRLALTFRENVAILERTRREALTDPLTGLGNRRALLRDLDAVLPTTSARAPWLLVLFDLNGFKSYNDAFGHPAGDALLARIGGRFRRCVALHGATYRLGGDEFCALLPVDGARADELSRELRAAFRERGEGFDISASEGRVLLPIEARTGEEALRAADNRMYAEKRGGRPSPGRQSTELLLRTLRECNPDLGTHSEGVAELVLAVAERLGVPEAERESVRLAAALHDVGKVAIPDAILQKPGPLTLEEWQFIHRHTVIGERILVGAPGLAAVAPLVRASHERYDGAGYPDGLAGDAIPLGARIVAVCDAFDSIIAERPYRPGRSTAAALAELERCAGSQFDPAVVEAFRAVLAERARSPLAA